MLQFLAEFPGLAGQFIKACMGIINGLIVFVKERPLEVAILLLYKMTHHQH